MSIEMQCKSCSEELTLPDAVAGMNGNCPHCKAEICVPAPECSEISYSRLSTLASVSLVLSVSGVLTSLFLIGLIPAAIAILVGGIALCQIRMSKGLLYGLPVAASGISIGAATVLFIVFAVLPCLAPSREFARQSVCKNNLKQIGLAMHMYAEDNNDWFPTTGTPGQGRESLSFLFDDYQPSARFFVCPSSYDKASTADDGPRFVLAENELSYYYANELTLAKSSNTPVAWDHAGNHASGRNVLFVGGHVRWVPETGFKSLLDEFGLTEE